MMTQALDTIEPALRAVVQGMKKEDFEAAQHSLHQLRSQGNAYTQKKSINANDGCDRWNMITYKTGQKSSL